MHTQSAARARRLLADAIRRERHLRGISQEQLAELCGSHRNTIGMIERDELSPTLDHLVALAAALKLEPSKLLERAGL